MFNFNNFNHFNKCWIYYRKKELGLIIAAVGVGIILALILPPWGWMIACAIGLILWGLLHFKKC